MIMSISVKELLKKTNPNIIDIRSVQKYNDNHINGAKHIPMALLLKEPYKYLQYDQTYYVYCQNGEQSKKVCISLANKNYNVVDVTGGYEDWLLEN